MARCNLQGVEINRLMKTGDFIAIQGFVQTNGFERIKQDMDKAICTGHSRHGFWIPKSTIENAIFIQSHAYPNGKQFDVYIIEIKKWFQEKSDASWFFRIKDQNKISETEIQQLINQI